VRTTIDLPEELHELVRRLAHDENRSMSEVISDLIRLGVRQTRADAAVARPGLPQVSVGRPITAEDVRSLDDDG
jgi:predicted transcriptional regulator